jgi:hypothetical protein
MADGGEIPASAVQMDAAPEEEIPHDAVQLDHEEIPQSAVKLDNAPPSKHATLGQQVIAGAEGAAQGLLGPAAPWLENKLLNVDYKDIDARAKANPITHKVAEIGTFAGSMLLGVGEAGLIAKGAGAIAEGAKLGKIGSAILRGAIETTSFAASDEITKAMLSQPNSDPEQPVSAALLHIGAAGIMGAVTGGVFTLGEGLIGKGLEALHSEKVVERAEKFIAKMAETGDPLGLKSKINELGADSLATSAAMMVPGPVQFKFAAFPALRKAFKPIVEKITRRPIGKANEYITDAFIKAIITNEASGLPNAIHYATQVAKGVQKANAGIEAIFKAGTSAITEPLTESNREELKQFIEDGQVDQQIQNQIQSNGEPQAFAKGGEVSASQSSDKFANIFPEQNTLLITAKGRISGYLNSIRPLPNVSQLPFDAKPQDKEKAREYNKAIDLAVNPLKILDRVNNGKLTPGEMKHFTRMYPEIYRYLSQGLTKRILKAQMDGEKPPYGKRQAMSLFLGAALESSLTPGSIQAAQAVFAQKKQSMQPQEKSKTKGDKKSLTKSPQSYLTAEQARERRQQSQKP